MIKFWDKYWYIILCVLIMSCIAFANAKEPNSAPRGFQEEIATKQLVKRLKRTNKYTPEQIAEYARLPIVVVPDDYKGGLIIITENYKTAFHVADTNIVLYEPIKKVEKK